jgi:hypothetical protein
MFWTYFFSIQSWYWWLYSRLCGEGFCFSCLTAWVVNGWRAFLPPLSLVLWAICYKWELWGCLFRWLGCDHLLVTSVHRAGCN